MSNTGFFRKRTLFSPTSIAGCQVWFDAADTATMGFSGTSVNTWTSKGTPSLTATYSGTAPTYSSYNTYPALAFNGSSTKMTTGTIASYGAAGSTWIAASINLTAVTSSTPADASVVIATNGPPERAIRYGNNTAATCYSIHTSILRQDTNNNTNGVRGFIDTPSSLQTFTNGANIITVNTSVTWQTATTTSFVLGQWNIGYLNGYIFECVVYDGILTLSQYQQVEGYLATKWGFRNLLPQGHPGVSSLLYPLSLKPRMIPRPYYTQFSPLSVAGCQLWVDAADTSTTSMTFSSGSNLLAWKDKSGSANTFNLTAGTTSNINDGGYSVISFPSGTYMTSANQVTFTSSSAFFIVSKLTSSSGIMLLAFPNTAGISGVGDFSIRFFGGVLNGTQGSGDGNDLGLSNYYVNGNFNPAYTSSYYSNYCVIDTTARIGGTSYLTLSSPLYDRYFIGNITEFLYYPAGVTLAQRQTLQSYLVQKWGLQAQLPANHPNNTTPAGTPALTAQVYGQVQRNIFPYFSYVTSGLRFHLDAGNPLSYPGSGSTWTDLAGSGLTTTLYGSPTYSSANGGYLSFVPASSQYGKTSAALATITTWTVELWHYFNATNSSGNPCLLTDIYNSSGGSPMNFVIGTVNGISQDLGSLYYSGSTWYGTANYSLPSVGWYHIVGTFDGSNLKLYINNILTRTSASTTTPVSGGIGIHIMRRFDSVGFTDFWGGYLSIVRIYGRALQASEISTNYAGSKARFGLS
jgi:hypothetical protein